MARTLPYLNAYGNIQKALKKIQDAATPPRFTQDFLATKLNLKGGSATPLIPFLKRTGFIGSDGVPTDLYQRFRNPTQCGRAAAEALRKGYSSLYEVNEYIHDASDTELGGVVVQVTGFDADSPNVRAIISSFKALKEFAAFDGEEENGFIEEDQDKAEERRELTDDISVDKFKQKLGLSYTINLNLPPTSDIAVFDAIFKSLRNNILK